MSEILVTGTNGEPGEISSGVTGTVKNIHFPYAYGNKIAGNLVFFPIILYIIEMNYSIVSGIIEYGD